MLTWRTAGQQRRIQGPLVLERQLLAGDGHLALAHACTAQHLAAEINYVRALFFLSFQIGNRAAGLPACLNYVGWPAHLPVAAPTGMRCLQGRNVFHTPCLEQEPVWAIRAGSLPFCVLNKKHPLVAQADAGSLHAKPCRPSQCLQHKLLADREKLSHSARRTVALG